MIIESQAQLYADVVRLKAGVNGFSAAADEKLMEEWKVETAKLIEDIIQESYREDTAGE